MKLIDRDALIKDMKTICSPTQFGRATARMCVMRAHIVDAVEVVHGKWIWERRHRGGFRIRNGVNKFGEKLSLQVDERYEIDEPYCSICGKWNESEF